MEESTLNGLEYEDDHWCITVVENACAGQSKVSFELVVSFLSLRASSVKY